MKSTHQRTHNQPAEAGQGFVEYALILILVGLAVVLVVSLMQPAIGDVFSRFVAQAPVAPPSLLNYTPPPTFTSTPTVDPLASPTPIPSITLVPSQTPTATTTSAPSSTPTATSTATATATVPCAYPAHTLPANGMVRVEMENFRCGGPGVAFFDNDGGPGSSPYRTDVGKDGPDLETTSDTGGGYNVGWVSDGEWLEYQVNAPQTLGYTFLIRHASNQNTNPRIRITVSQGQLQYNSVIYTLGPTNGWQDWKSTMIGPITLFAGSNTVRITMETGSGNYNYFEVHTYVPTATPTPVTPTPTSTSTPTATNTPTATPSLQLYLEAESGNGLTGSWFTANSSSASGGKYIYWGGSTNTSTTPPTNQVTYSFNAPSAGLYRVYLRVNNSGSANRDSVWVRIDGATVNQSQNITRSDGWVNFNNMVLANSFNWRQVHNGDSGNALVQFYLPAGSHTLRFAYREAQTWIDRIFITNTSSLP